MSKQVILILCSVFLIGSSCQNKKEGKFDERAVETLDQMSEEIGTFKACSYTISSEVNEKEDSISLITTYKVQDVYMRGPNKMYFHSEGTMGSHSYWYNGSTLAYFSYDKNAYDEVEAPDNIVAAIDFLNEEYGIEFPAADIFYPTLTDDILEYFDEFYFWGETIIEEVAYTEVEALNANQRLVLLINSETHLPYRLLFVDHSKSEEERYDVTFSNWKVNPDLPDILFEFDPPSNSTRVHLPKKN